ncbi:MAG: hypothetical protein V6Z82_00330 [Flavobacteriales bacterium]
MKKPKRPTTSGKTALKILISLLALLFLCSLYHRSIFIDDGWLGEYAHSFAEHGVVRTKLFHLYYQSLGMDNTAVYSYHKLLIWLGGLLIYLSGQFNPYLLKSISLAAYVALILIVLYDYRNRLPNKNISRLILLFYLLVLPNLIRLSFMYRPELVVTLFGYLSFRYLSYNSGRKSLFLAGLFAGIATLLNLNGLVFILSGIAYIALYHKNFRTVLLFGLGASICLLYFADVAYDHGYLIWWEQLRTSRAVLLHNERNILISWRKLNNLFFRGINELAYSIPLVLSLFFLLRNKITVLKAEIRYLVLLILMLYFFSVSGTIPFYNIYPYPYAIVLITYVISIALSRKGYAQPIAILVLGCSFSIAMHQCGLFIFKKNTDIYRAYKTVNQIIPKHSKVLAAPSIVFNPNFTDYDIAADQNAVIMNTEMVLKHKMTETYRKRYITQFCIQNHFDYLVVRKGFLGKFKLSENTFKPLTHIPKAYWIYKVISPE